MNDLLSHSVTSLDRGGPPSRGEAECRADRSDSPRRLRTPDPTRNQREVTGPYQTSADPQLRPGTSSPARPTLSRLRIITGGQSESCVERSGMPRFRRPQSVTARHRHRVRSQQRKLGALLRSTLRRDRQRAQRFGLSRSGTRESLNRGGMRSELVNSSRGSLRMVGTVKVATPVEIGVGCAASLPLSVRGRTGSPLRDVSISCACQHLNPSARFVDERSGARQSVPRQRLRAGSEADSIVGSVEGTIVAGEVVGRKAMSVSRTGASWRHRKASPPGRGALPLRTVTPLRRSAQGAFLVRLCHALRRR